MGRVVAMKNLHQTNNRNVSEKARTHSTLDTALKELKKQTGLDYRKLLAGDQRENQSLRMKQYQESMLT